MGKNELGYSETIERGRMSEMGGERAVEDLVKRLCRQKYKGSRLLLPLSATYSCSFVMIKNWGYKVRGDVRLAPLCQRQEVWIKGFAACRRCSALRGWREEEEENYITSMELQLLGRANQPAENINSAVIRSKPRMSPPPEFATMRARLHKQN